MALIDCVFAIFLIFFEFFCIVSLFSWLSLAKDVSYWFRNLKLFGLKIVD